MLHLRIYFLITFLTGASRIFSQAVLYNEPFNSSLNTCTAVNSSNGSWIWTNACAYNNLGGHSAPGCAFFSGNGCQFGNGGLTTSGNLITPTIALGPAGGILNFNYIRVGEWINYWDMLTVQVSNNGGTTYNSVLSTSIGGGLIGYDMFTPTLNIVWNQACYNLSAYANQTVIVRFNFNTIDGINNYIDGIYVDDITITVPTPLTVWQSTNNVCPGTAVTLSTNAVAGFSWSTGATTPVIVVTPTVTTTYSVNSCSGTAGGTGSLVVNVTPQLSLNIVSSSPGSVVCTGAQVQLSAFASGGIPGYNYTWQGSAPGSTYAPNQNSPGVYTYSATVTDAHPCSFTQTISLSFIQSPTLTSIPGQTICPGTSATITTSGANTYTWFPGGIFSNSIVVNPTVQSTYSVTGTNTITGCTNTGTTEIHMKPTSGLAVTQASITCAALGFGTVTPIGGIGPFSFNWSPTNQTTAIANNLNTSIYTITVNDAGTGCVITTTTQYTPLTPLTALLNHDTILRCHNMPTGSAHFTNIANGSGSELYLWDNGITTFTNNSPASLNTGNWSVTVTDALTGCQVFSVFTITQPPPLVLNLSASVPSICVGGQIVLTGTTSGGTPGYQHNWTNGPASDTFTISGNTAGSYTYTLIGTDVNTCSISNTVAVDFIPNPVLTVSDVSICPLETGTLTVSGASTYLWDNSAVTNTISDSPPVTTVYSVTGSALGCTTMATASIVVKPLPIPLISSNSPRCENSDLLLFAAGGSLYNWSGPLNFSSAAQNPILNTVGLTHAGVYDLTVTAVNSCTAATSLSVVVNPTPALSATGATVCTIQPANLFANSLPGASYQWLGPLSFNSNQQNPILNNPSLAASGDYSVKATSAVGCTNTAIANVLIVNPPSLTTQLSSHSLCSQAFNGSPNTITLSAGGASTYSLVTVPDLLNANPAGPVSPLSAIPPNTGVASATLYGSNGICTVTAGLTFTIIPNPTVSVNNYTPEICAGESFTYTNNGANSYTWNAATPNFTTYNNGGVAVAHPSISSVFSVYGGSLGCNSASKTSSITVYPIPTVSITPANSQICIGSSTLLTAGGTATEFSWKPNTGLNTTSGYQVSASPRINQTYTLTGSANNCTNTAIASITVMALPQPVAKVSKPFVCMNETITLTGSGGEIFDWKGPNNLSYGGSTVNFVAGPAHGGEYTLSVTDQNGCMNSTVTLVTIKPLPQGSLVGSKMQSCVPFCTDFNYYNPTGTGSLITSSWEIDRKNINGKTFSYCFTKAGENIITGKFKDTVSNCIHTQTFIVNGLPVPKADFNWLPQKPIEGLEDVLFLNSSTGEQQTKFKWYFINNNGYRSDNENTSYFFREAGTYPVAYVVENTYGCADTIVKHITIETDFIFYMPNTFTPNGDELNDVFVPVMRGIKFYTLMVFDRWGELLFTTEDPTQGWDGSYRSEPCKQNVYGWKVSLSTVHGERKDYSGSVTLMR